jgi:hypothetical protein
MPLLWCASTRSTTGRTVDDRAVVPFYQPTPNARTMPLQSCPSNFRVRTSFHTAIFPIRSAPATGSPSTVFWQNCSREGLERGLHEVWQTI